MTPPSAVLPPPRPDAPAHRPGASLTSRGWGLTLMAVVMAVAADVLGIAELYPVAAAALILVLSAVGWSWTRRWRIDVGRRLPPGRIEAGAPVPIVVTLHNRADKPSPVLVLRDPSDGGRRMTTMAVAPIAAHERIAGSYRLAPTGRGLYSVGPLSLEASDPLGLSRRTRQSTVVSTYVVHPRVERLRAPRVAGGTDRNRGSALPVSGQGNDEFASLREYQLGDDVRRMHWVSTARTDTLMVREDQLERRGQFSVVLDTRGASWAAADFEQGVSAAASIGIAALEAGLHVRMLTTGGLDSGAGAGRVHGTRMLDLLAGLRLPTGHSPGGDGASLAGLGLPAGGTVAVITSGSVPPDDVCRAVAGGHTDTILVVIDAAPSSRRSAGAAGAAGAVAAAAGAAGRTAVPNARIVRVGAGAPLAPAWDPRA